MKKPVILFFILCFILIALRLSWFVLNGDIVFSSDIARDFHLLGEIDEKKVILIGPRSSTGLFHGPLWLYLNYPAYLLGEGNPIVVGWWWVILMTGFSLSCYFVGKKLFNQTVGMLFSLYTGVYGIFHVNGLYNPHGAMFLVPWFFYTFVRFAQTTKIFYLVWSIVLSGLITQFQLAVGIPLMFLLSLFTIVRTVQTKQLILLIPFLLVPVLFSNFIVFDLRHDFLLSKIATGFATSNTTSTRYEMGTYVADRINQAFIYPEIFRTNDFNRNYYAVPLLLLLALAAALKDKKNRTVYASFLYIYFGFFILSIINKGFLLYFYIFPFFPLLFLMISSFAATRYKKIAIAAVVIIILSNVKTAFTDMQYSKAFFGTSRHSWKLFSTSAADAFKGEEEELGYFVFSPDSVAYPEKYAMLYQAKQTNKTSYYFTKKPVTYVFIGPPPENGLGFGPDYWIENMINITGQPVEKKIYNADIQLWKYELDSEDIQVPFDPAIDPGISFR